MDIIVRNLPHEDQRYDTVGDWQIVRQGNRIRVCVSRMDNWRFEALVALHEIVEAVLCKHAGISSADVDAFDTLYEEMRKAGDTGEPGDDPRAPYHRQHLFATKLERLLADELGIDWEEYETAINSL